MASSYVKGIFEKMLRKCWDSEFDWSVVPDNIYKVRIISDFYYMDRTLGGRSISLARSLIFLAVSHAQAKPVAPVDTEYWDRRTNRGRK